VPVRPLLARCGLALLVVLGGALVAVGAVSLGPSGVFPVALAAGFAACIAAGIAREGDHPDPRRAAVESARRTAVGTVAALLLLSGAVVLVGAALTALALVTVLGGLLVRGALRAARAGRQAPARPIVPPGVAGDPGPAPAVGLMSVPELGREWVHSSAALAGTRDTLARQELVRRRSEALDELERRDPIGFARWLEAGATVDSDPAEYVSGDPAAGSAAA
jgi:hypothetical protein